MSKKSAFVYLYIPMALAILLDYALTMDGNRRYFLGTSMDVNEDAPIGKFLLRIGPASFTVCIGIYLAGLWLLVKTLPERFKIFIFLLMTYLHAYGAESWVQRHIPITHSFQWYFHVGFITALTALVTVMFLQYCKARDAP